MKLRKQEGDTAASESASARNLEPNSELSSPSWIDRRIPHLMAGYGGMAWAVLEAASWGAERYAWSPQRVDTLVVLLVAAFPGALILTWRHGLAGEQEFTRGELVAAATSFLLFSGGLTGTGLLRAPKSSTPATRQSLVEAPQKRWAPPVGYQRVDQRPTDQRPALDAWENDRRLRRLELRPTGGRTVGEMMAVVADLLHLDPEVAPAVASQPCTVSVTEVLPAGILLDRMGVALELQWAIVDNRILRISAGKSSAPAGTEGESAPHFYYAPPPLRGKARNVRFEEKDPRDARLVVLGELENRQVGEFMKAAGNTVGYRVFVDPELADKSIVWRGPGRPGSAPISWKDFVDYLETELTAQLLDRGDWLEFVPSRNVRSGYNCTTNCTVGEFLTFVSGIARLGLSVSDEIRQRGIVLQGVSGSVAEHMDMLSRQEGLEWEIRNRILEVRVASSEP